MEYLYVIAPFFKNISILYLVVFLLFLAAAINKSGGLDAFSMQFWFEENKGRFQVAAVFIACLSILMALTDVAPIFKVLGFDINQSPAGLGLAIAALLGIAKTKSSKVTTKKATKAKAIQRKAGEIVKDSAAIVQEEKDKKGVSK